MQFHLSPTDPVILVDNKLESNINVSKVFKTTPPASIKKYPLDARKLLDHSTTYAR